MNNIDRRQFLKILAGTVLSFSLGKLHAVTGGVKSSSGVGSARLAVIKGKDTVSVTRRAIQAVGGMRRYVKKGDTVVVKPNMAWDSRPEYAVNSNPVVVSEIVKMCYESGAKKVKVFDRTCSNKQLAYDSSGIADSARACGADVFYVDDWNYVKARFDYDSPISGWPIYRDAVKCDSFINVPVVKDHKLTKLTLSMKNLMGVMGGDRGQVHWNISKKLAHLTDFIKPGLTVIDATRVLFRNGPRGGNLEDVRVMDTVIATADPVLADSEASRLMGIDPMEIGYIEEAVKMDLGEISVDKSLIIREAV